MTEQNENINISAEEYEQALSEQNRIRREKLKTLQDANQDPLPSSGQSDSKKLLKGRDGTI